MVAALKFEKNKIFWKNLREDRHKALSTASFSAKKNNGNRVVLAVRTGCGCSLTSSAGGEFACLFLAENGCNICPQKTSIL